MRVMRQGLARSWHGMAVVALGLLTTVGVAKAATITSDAFVAVVRPTAAFLARSGALAEETSANRRLLAVARREAKDEGAVGRAIEAWQGAEDRRIDPNPFEASLDRLTAAGKSLTIPFDAVAAAVAPASPPLTALPSATAIAAAGEDDLRRLSTLRGPAFDAAFVAVDREALVRLIQTYKGFILNGDDPVLRGIAVHDLPRVERDLAALDGVSSS